MQINFQNPQPSQSCKDQSSQPLSPASKIQFRNTRQYKSNIQNQEDEDDELDFLPNNLNTSQTKVKIIAPKPQQQEQSTYYQTLKKASPYFYKRSSVLSEIMECNNECSSIIFHPEKKSELKSMPNIIQQKTQVYAAQYTEQEQSILKLNRASVIDTADGSQVKSGLTQNNPSNKIVKSNLKILIIFVLLTAIICAGSYYFISDKSQDRIIKKDKKIKNNSKSKSSKVKNK